MRVGLPVTLSLQEYPPESSSWCTTVSADLTALELSAGLYYRWCWFFDCGPRKDILKSGTWDVFRRRWKLIKRCN